MEIKPCLENLKSNVIRWYKFKENSKILIIGKDVKPIYDFLSKNHETVNLYKATSRVVGNFDYIIIKDDISLISLVRYNLKPDTTILLLMNNRFGVSYFARTDGIETVRENVRKFLTKEEIESSLKKKGYHDYRFFYPLPNYDFANAIYSDKFLPKYNDSKLANNNIYLNNENISFDEIKMLRHFTKSGDFTKFTNSYLIEINPKSTEKAIFYNNIRKDEYRLITKIYDKYVEKEIYTEISQNHINTIKENIEDIEKHGFTLLDKIEDNKVISKYVTMNNLYEKVVGLLKNGEVEKAILIIEDKYNFIKEKFKNNRVTEINTKYFKNLSPKGLFIVDKAYIDLAFENIFIDEKENMYIYDQEWFIENCPLEFLLFRIIFNMYMMNGEITEMISRDDLLKRFNLFEYWETFLNAETIFQEKIVNKEIKEYYDKRAEFLSKQNLDPNAEFDRCNEIKQEYNRYLKHIKRFGFLKKIGLIKF